MLAPVAHGGWARRSLVALSGAEEAREALPRRRGAFPHRGSPSSQGLRGRYKVTAGVSKATARFGPTGGGVLASAHFAAIVQFQVKGLGRGRGNLQITTKKSLVNILPR